MASYREVAGMLGAFVRAVETGNGPHRNGTMMTEAKRLLTEAAKGLRQPTAWTPFERRDFPPLNEAHIAKVAEVTGLPVEGVRENFLTDRREMELWANSTYQVLVRRDGTIWLSIKRLDQQPIHAWRDLQRIKNELVGPEHEGVEIYPAESRLVDQSNQYHLWVSPTEGHTIPFGFGRREVSDVETGLGEAQAPREDPMTTTKNTNPGETT